jgi:RNA polymerase sigma-70 factor, ECF subfamily
MSALKGSDFDRLGRLMRRALDGDACAYEEALRSIAQIVRAYARARLGDTLADDVVQETLLSVHQARHTYDPNRPFGPWLLAVAHSRVVDAARRARRRKLHEERLDEEPAGEREDSRERSVRVSQALQQLPQRQRRVIELLKLEGWSALEVADALRLSVSNVKVIAHRGYSALRRTLKDES